MKIFEIIDGDKEKTVGALLYFEKERTCIFELQEYLDEWSAPFLFASYVKNKVYTIPRDVSALWVRGRVIPSGRQNISDILKVHHLKEYDEMKFLEISEGRCSQDEMYIRQLDKLPEFVVERQQKNLSECVILGAYNILCFFADGNTRKINLKNISKNDSAAQPIDRLAGLDKVLENDRLYRSGKLGTGGYFVTFNDSIDIPADILYESGEKVPLGLEDFKTFVRRNIIDTTESCEMLECSRQNISYMVNQEQMSAVKEDVRGNLYLKGEVLSNRW